MAVFFVCAPWARSSGCKSRTRLGNEEVYSRTARVSIVKWNLKEAVSKLLVRRTKNRGKVFKSSGTERKERMDISSSRFSCIILVYSICEIQTTSVCLLFFCYGYYHFPLIYQAFLLMNVFTGRISYLITEMKVKC